MTKPVLKAAAAFVAAFALGIGVGLHLPTPFADGAESPASPRLVIQSPPECFEAFNQTPDSVGYEADRLACLKHANN